MAFPSAFLPPLRHTMVNHHLLKTAPEIPLDQTSHPCVGSDGPHVCIATEDGSRPDGITSDQTDVIVQFWLAIQESLPAFRDSFTWEAQHLAEADRQAGGNAVEPCLPLRLRENGAKREPPGSILPEGDRPDVLREGRMALEAVRKRAEDSAAKQLYAEQEEVVKTLILGTGIIGTIYGWALQSSGLDVTHYVRKNKASTCRGGVSLDILDERKGHEKKNLTTYPIKCVEAISSGDGYELIIVPTNSYQTEGALKDLLPNSGSATFLILAANWEGTAFIDRLLPRERYLLGYPDGGGTRREGVYWTNLGAEIHLGEVDGVTTEKLGKVVDLFRRADMNPDIQENILHWLWLHNAMSVGIWAGFAKYRQVKPFLADRPLLVQCFDATKELLELCRLRGVEIKKYPDTSTFRLPTWLFIILFRWLYTHNESMQRYTAHGADSLLEAKVNYEAIGHTASELGFEMPNLKALGIHLREIPV